MLAPTAAALRRWVSDARLHEALVFEPIECDVDGADGQLAPGTGLDFATNRRPISLRPKPNHREEDDLLKVAQGEDRTAGGYMFHIGEAYDGIGPERVGNMSPMRPIVTVCIVAFGVGLAANPMAQSAADRQKLLTPTDPVFTARAPAVSQVRLDTTQGPVVIEVIRAWAPLGADRFVNLVRHGYYDDARIFRIRPNTWAQFGIAGDPKVAQAWRPMTFPDDPAVGQSNARGTIAFAFAVPNGRTTQMFINLRDNSATHDKEPFVPFGRVVEGIEAVDAFYAKYGEGLGGIRAGKQDAGFAEGNAFFDREFPLLDRIKNAVVVTR